MKIIIAPDSFKGCMRSPQVCESIKKGILSVAPDAEVVSMPMADGGEGTMEAMCLTAGRIEKIKARDPLGRKIEAEFGIIGDGDTAVMEMASASGLELLTREELNPLTATTYGTGEIIREILGRGIREIIVGIGGSARVDGGAGMAQALGYRLLDANGKELASGWGSLADLRSIDTSRVDPRLKKVKIRVACDVTNPLLGSNGAARVFAPQKGASPEMVEQLESNLANFADVLIKEGLIDNAESPGDGAAGGLGVGLRAFCGAKIESGAKLMIDITGLEKELRDSDLIITGEGCTDAQTSSGKLCAAISDAARKANIPIVLLSGALKGDLGNLHNMFDAAFSISTGPCTLDEALAATKENLFLAGQSIAGLFIHKNKAIGTEK